MSTASPAILSNSLKNSELKTTHNTFRGCLVPFLEIAVYIYWYPVQVPNLKNDNLLKGKTQTKNLMAIAQTLIL